MASFVREVLSATGTLGDKEDFPGKILKIQKKLHDLKSSLQTHIDSRYADFATNLNDASSITAQMEELGAEIETINNNINNHLKTQISDCSKELLDLTNQIQEINLSLQVVTKIKTCYDAIEEGNEFVREGRWLSASQTLARSLDLVRSSSYKMEEENIRILPAIKLEMIRQQQKLQSVICQQWKDCVVLTRQGEESVIVVKFQGDVEEPAAELLQAMYFSELLEEQLVKLVTNLKEYFLQPMLSNTCQLSMDDKKLVLMVTSTTTPTPDQVFQQVKELFQFLFVNLEVPLPPNSTLMAELSPHLSSWLCDKLVRLVLAPAVPDTPEELHTYEEVVLQTEELHEYLVNIGLIAQENKTILNYARNVDAIFASKVCENMLAEAREIMKKDLYITAEVGPGKLEDLGIPQTESEDQLAIPPNFPLPSTCFQFPSCLVSQSVLDLLALAERGLDHAATSKPFCSIRIFHTVRNLFTLWCAVTPTYHASALSSLPQLAALAHNSAMFLAHKVITLGFSYKEKLTAVSGIGGVPTLVDLVPKLREVGADTLLASLRLQRDQLKQILNTAGFPALATDRRLSSGAEQGIKQVLHTLGHLQKVWGKVLPGTVYLRCQGTLLNTVLEELIQIITSLEDISADAGGQLVSLLGQLVAKTPNLFPSEEPGRFVKRWAKFKELIFMLGATLREIEERWGGGKGKLGEEFPAEQVKQMVRALFQNTERRAAVLAKIK